MSKLTTRRRSKKISFCLLFILFYYYFSLFLIPVLIKCFITYCPDVRLLTNPRLIDVKDCTFRPCFFFFFFFFFFSSYLDVFRFLAFRITGFWLKIAIVCSVYSIYLATT